MASIQKMSISGVRSFDPHKTPKEGNGIIKFFSPLTLILGPNGTGKTTIIECLKYCTTGDTPPGTAKGASWVHDPKISGDREVKAQVLLKFGDIRGQHLKIKRLLQTSFQRNKLSVKTLEATIVDDPGSVALSSKCADINKEMERLLGVSKPILENVIFCHQEDANWPLSEGKVLKEKFDALFDSQKYVKALDVIKKKRLSLHNKLPVYEKDEQNLCANKNKAREFQARYDNLCLNRDKCEEDYVKVVAELDPVQKRINDVLEKRESIQALKTEIGNSETKFGEVDKRADRYRASIKKTFPGPTEELEHDIEQYGAVVKQKEANMNQLEDELARLQANLAEVTERKNRALLLQGRLKGEAQAHQERTRERNNKITELARENSIKGYDRSSSITGEMAGRFRDALNGKMDAILQDAKQAKEKFEADEEALQMKINLLKQEQAALKNMIQLKQNTTADNTRRLQEIDALLAEADTAETKYKSVEQELQKVEAKLQNFTASNDVEEMKREVTKFEASCRDTENQIRVADEELAQLNKKQGIRSQIAFINTSRMTKQKEISKILNKHTDFLERLLGEIPKEHLKRRIDRCSDEKSSALPACQKQKSQNERQMQSAQFERTSSMKELERIQTEIKEYEQKLFEVCGSGDFKENLSKIQSEIATMRDERSVFKGLQQAQGEYIKILEKDSEPACPLCEREFDKQEEVVELLEDLRRKQSDIPKILAQSEERINRLQLQYDSMLQLQPMQEKIKQYKDFEIPKVQRCIEKSSKLIEGLREQFLKLEKDCGALESDMRMVDAVKPDVTVMERSSNELATLNSKLKALQHDLGAGSSTKTVEQVQLDKDNLRDSLDDTREALNSKRIELEKALKLDEQLKDHRLRLKSEILGIEKRIQSRIQVINEQNKLGSDNKVLKEDIQKLKGDYGPIDSKCSDLAKERLLLVNKKNKVSDEDQTRISYLRASIQGLEVMQNEINAYISSMKKEQLEDCDRQLHIIEDELTRFKRDIARKDQDKAELKQQIDAQEMDKRELIDNLELRKSEAELVDLRRVIQKLEVELGDFNIDSMAREIEKLRVQQDGLIEEKHTLSERKQSLRVQCTELERELNDKLYKNAEDDHFKMCVKIKVTKSTVEDLQIIYSNLEQAILEYHRIKMEALNESIKELWRNTYKGHDIDTIQICADDMAGTSTRRSYNYRVVMMRGDTPLDMRGRCSAGQKVLASLIIRLALAETFCVNCGILALDEPTTNLDRENIISLANALIQLVESRAEQAGFQLVIITHDEDFVELLGRSQFVDVYWRVSKTADGYSQITSKKVNELRA